VQSCASQGTKEMRSRSLPCTVCTHWDKETILFLYLPTEIGATAPEPAEPVPLPEIPGGGVFASQDEDGARLHDHQIQNQEPTEDFGFGDIVEGAEDPTEKQTKAYKKKVARREKPVRNRLQPADYAAKGYVAPTVQDLQTRAEKSNERIEKLLRRKADSDEDLPVLRDMAADVHNIEQQELGPGTWEPTALDGPATVASRSASPVTLNDDPHLRAAQLGSMQQSEAEAMSVSSQEQLPNDASQENMQAEGPPQPVLPPDETADWPTDLEEHLGPSPPRDEPPQPRTDSFEPFGPDPIFEATWVETTQFDQLVRTANEFPYLDKRLDDLKWQIKFEFEEFRKVMVRNAVRFAETEARRPAGATLFVQPRRPTTTRGRRQSTPLPSRASTPMPSPSPGPRSSTARTVTPRPSPGPRATSRDATPRREQRGGQEAPHREETEEEQKEPEPEVELDALQLKQLTQVNELNARQAHLDVKGRVYTTKAWNQKREACRVRWELAELFHLVRERTKRQPGLEGTWTLFCTKVKGLDYQTCLKCGAPGVHS